MKKLTYTSLAMLGLATVGTAQIPDLLSSFDAGSRSMGAGGAFGVTGADTFSALNNPAGLGYLSTKTYGLAYRNLPRTNTSLSGNVGSPLMATNDSRGNSALTHLGYATQLKNGQTLGFSYQIGGYINDVRSGTGMTSGGLTNVAYQESIEAKTDFYTFALGKSNDTGTRSIGWGLTIANVSYTDDQFSFQQGNPQVLLVDSTFNGNGSGVGLVGGMQWSNPNNPNTSYGVSLRTPIKLNGTIDSAYSTIPGQVSLGFTTRKDGFRGESNYLLYGAQVSQQFGGSGSGVLDRSSQTIFGAGLEFNQVSTDYTVPIRLGYSTVGSGGNGFASRTGMTFGFGYRPNTQPWGVDVNYSMPNVGGRDFALLFSYRFNR